MRRRCARLPTGRRADAADLVRLRGARWTGAPGEVGRQPVGLDGVAVGGATTANGTPAARPTPAPAATACSTARTATSRWPTTPRSTSRPSSPWPRGSTALDAAGAAHDRVEGHELRVPRRQSTPRLLVVERQHQHHALDHDDDAARAEPVVSRRHHVRVRAQRIYINGTLDGTTAAMRARSRRTSCRSS